jgi:soluble lytic murein transglycosylase
MRDLFLNHLATAATTPERLALVAGLAQDVASIPERLRVAKAALRRGVVLLEAGWPRMELPRDVAVEPALALAIIRQESEFDPLARSSANARGLMQLLPATARQVARKNDLSYDDDTLDNPQENVTLGALYLGKLVSGFDGSYILGIASYNAGPGNVRNWIKLRGEPPENLNGALNWIESIPFAETRNYVMRALENVQIYRSLASPEVGMRLEQDLVR